MDVTDQAEAGPATRGRPRWGRRVLAVLGVLVLVAAFVLWWTWPANRIDRQFARLDLPDGVEQTHEVADPQFWVFDCFDACSTTTRYYTTSLSEEATADAVVRALRDSGFEVEGRVRCAPRSGTGRIPHAVRECSYNVSGQGDGYNAYALIGPRVDGKPGLSVQISVSG